MNAKTLAAAFFVATLSAIGVLFALQDPAPPPPPASGEVGRLFVFGQVKTGPVEIREARPKTLPRPQYLAFQFDSTGKGPRFVRIELEVDGRRSVVFEERVGAPAEDEALGFVQKLGDDDPDDVKVIVTIEAPHAEEIVQVHEINLAGAEHPFWEK